MNKQVVTSLLFFGAVAFCIYSKVLYFDFAWDDYSFLVNNPFLEPPQNLFSFFSNPLTFAPDPDAQIYRPLRNIFWYGIVCLFGKNSFYFHGFQLLFHALNSFLVFFFLFRILKINKPASMAGGLLFLMHPLQTEAVCWIKSTDDVLCVFFGLCGLLFLISGIRRENMFRISLSLLMLFFSMLCKESGIFLVFLYAFFIVSELKKNKKHFLVSLIILSASYLILRSLALRQLGQVESLTGNWFSTQLGMSAIYLEYFFKMFVPVYQHVNYMGYSPFDFFSPFALAGLWISLILLFGMLFRLCRGIRVWIFALIMSFLPVSNLIPMMQWGAERFLYFPMVFFIFVFLYRLSRLKYPYMAGLILCLYLCGLGAANLQRQTIWKNNATLGESMLLSNPASYHGLFLTLEAYKKQERWNDLIRLGEKYLALYPDQEEIYNYLAYACLQKGQTPRALEIITQGLIRFPKNELLLNFRTYLNSSKEKRE